MELWIVRAGADGEHEDKFLNDNRIYLTWDGLCIDLKSLENRDELNERLSEIYPDFSENRRYQHAGQIWSFANDVKTGEWVILPSKTRSAIHVAEVVGDYEFDPQAEDPYFHCLRVRWIEKYVPRTNFDKDLLASFNAYRTVCRARAHEADKRVREMNEGGWKPTSILGPMKNEETEDPSTDVAQSARDDIMRLIVAKFKGDEMEGLVDAVLRAKGYVTYRTPKGRDKGRDVLAAPEPMGFGKPRICVQVKSGSEALGSKELRELQGTMSDVNATHGLLVSWGGFRDMSGDVATQFFSIRLWDQGDLVDQVLTHYDQLDPDIRDKLPLKRIWVVVNPEG